MGLHVRAAAGGAEAGLSLNRSLGVSGAGVNHTLIVTLSLWPPVALKNLCPFMVSAVFLATGSFRSPQDEIAKALHRSVNVAASTDAEAGSIAGPAKELPIPTKDSGTLEPNPSVVLLLGVTWRGFQHFPALWPDALLADRNYEISW